MQGIKPPRKKAKKTKEAKVEEEKKRGELHEIHLERKETDSVPVYDTCDEIRRKISAYLKTPGVTQTQFLRDLAAQYHSANKPSKISTTLLSGFRGKKGPKAGCTNSVYYTAYCVFKKQRIKDGKPKGKVRQEMQEIYGPNGMPRDKDAAHQRFSIPVGTGIREDKYERISIGNGPYDAIKW